MRILTILTILSLTACADEQIVYKPLQVDVPVSSTCTPPNVQKPVWPTETKPVGLFKRVQAALVEIELRRGYDAKLEAAIKACTDNH